MINFLKIGICFLLLAFFSPPLAQAQSSPSAQLPTRLLVDWQLSGSTISTPIPLLSWDNPAEESQIDTVVVRVGKNPQMGFCPTDLVIDHWFVTPESPQPCSTSAVTKSPFTKEAPPKSFIVPPVNPLQSGNLLLGSKRS